MNRDLDPRREPAVDVERYVVEFMAQYMIRVLHILRGSLERKDLMSSFCTSLDLLCTKILGLNLKVFGKFHRKTMHLLCFIFFRRVVWQF